jgi:hypothetical protein
MDDQQQKYRQALQAFSEPPIYPEKIFMVAICHVKLGEYPKVLEHFRKTLQGFLADPQNSFWRRSGQVNFLVDCYAMTNQPDLYPQVFQNIEEYHLDRRSRALMPQYAFSLVRLMGGKDQEIIDYVENLLKKPKIKLTYAMGKTIEAIRELEQSTFNEELSNLLKAHRGMAKFGGLRESPEGYLCLQAMSLSKIALLRGMNLDIESEYLSKGYLDFLLSGNQS